jgi:gas vesicle protein
MSNQGESSQGFGAVFSRAAFRKGKYSYQLRDSLEKARVERVEISIQQIRTILKTYIKATSENLDKLAKEQSNNILKILIKNTSQFKVFCQEVVEQYKEYEKKLINKEETNKETEEFLKAQYQEIEDEITNLNVVEELYIKDKEARETTPIPQQTSNVPPATAQQGQQQIPGQFLVSLLQTQLRADLFEE